MDLNNPKPQNGQINFTPIAVQPQSPQHQANSPKKLLLMLLSLFILLFLAGLVLLLTNPRSSSSKGRTDFKILTPRPQPSATPALSEEEQELESVDVGSLEPDFQDIEADLQEL